VLEAVGDGRRGTDVERRVAVGAHDHAGALQAEVAQGMNGFDAAAAAARAGRAAAIAGVDSKLDVLMPK
jgi:hypothetical protein